MTKLITALREKFPEAKDVLRTLGLDENLLRKETDMKPQEGAVSSALIAGLRTQLAQDEVNVSDLVELLSALNATKAIEEAEEADEEEDEDDTDEEEDDEDEGDGNMSGMNTEANGGIPGLAKKDDGEEEDVIAKDAPEAKIHEMLKDKLSPEELELVGKLLEQVAGAKEDGEVAEAKDEGSEEDDAEGEDEDMVENKEDLVTKPAMDEAIKSAVSAAEERARKNERSIRAAERAVRPYVGELAMDECPDASAVYRKALVMMGVKGAATVHASALPVLLENMPKPGAAPAQRREMGMDAAAADGFAKMFPNSARIQREI